MRPCGKEKTSFPLTWVSKWHYPHGTDASRQYVNFTQLVFVRFENEVSWDGELVKLCIGIAAKGDEHGELLGNLAEKLLDEVSYKTFMESNSQEELLELINS